uniref:Uncharacterized protein n=1 Tax=Anguilla anguilla TaxID=7936 RepID=A0A0E9S5P9_ANGAN
MSLFAIGMVMLLIYIHINNTLLTV